MGHSNNISLSDVKEPLLSSSVVLIYLYLIFYTSYEAFTDRDEKDEDFIQCACRESDKRYYIGIFVAFTIIWIAVVSTWYLFSICDCCKWCKGDKKTTLHMSLIRLFMEPVAFITLITIIPLVFLQLFSTYAWMCFTNGNYCEISSINKLQMDRNFVLFGFYACASILGLYAKMVKTPQKTKDYTCKRCSCCAKI